MLSWRKLRLVSLDRTNCIVFVAAAGKPCIKHFNINKSVIAPRIIPPLDPPLISILHSCLSFYIYMCLIMLKKNFQFWSSIHNINLLRILSYCSRNWSIMISQFLQWMSYLQQLLKDNKNPLRILVSLLLVSRAHMRPSGNFITVNLSLLGNTLHKYTKYRTLFILQSIGR